MGRTKRRNYYAISCIPRCPRALAKTSVDEHPLIDENVLADLTRVAYDVWARNFTRMASMAWRLLALAHPAHPCEAWSACADSRVSVFGTPYSFRMDAGGDGRMRHGGVFARNATLVCSSKGQGRAATFSPGVSSIVYVMMAHALVAPLEMTCDFAGPPR